MSKQAIHVTDGDFEAQVLKAGVVLVDFWAPWCGPCRAIAPSLEALAAEYAGRLVVAKVNVDDNKLNSETYNVKGIPCLIFFRDGVEVKRQVGGVPFGKLRMIVDEVLSAGAPADDSAARTEFEAAIAAAEAQLETSQGTAYTAYQAHFKTEADAFAASYKPFSDEVDKVVAADRAKLAAGEITQDAFDELWYAANERLSKDERLKDIVAAIEAAQQVVHAASAPFRDELNAAFAAAEAVYNAAIDAARQKLAAA